MNTDNTNTSEAVAIAAAKTLKRFRKAKEKKSRSGNFPLTLGLAATQEQIDKDTRLQVVYEFYKATKPAKNKKKSSPRREFVIQALYDAIVAAAHENDAMGKDDTHILS